MLLRAFRKVVGRSAIIGGLLVAAVLGLGGCSALRLGYGAAPDAAYWWLDRYIDFEGGQSAQVRAAIAHWFDWHRRTQLPDYADQLALARVEVLADTTPARVCAWQGELVKRARLAYDRIAPAAAAFLPRVTPEQVAHLERRYARLDADYRDDFLQADPKRRAAKSLERVVDRAESLYGRLDAAQRARIAETLARSPFDPERWLAERQLRQQDAVRIVRAASEGRQTPAQAQVALNGYVERLERSPRPEYRSYVARLTEFNCAYVAEIHNATTPAQRRTAADRIAGWEGDLRAIVAARPTAPRVEP